MEPALIPTEVIPPAAASTNALDVFKPFMQVLEENEQKALAMQISADMPPEQRKNLAKEARRLRLDCFAVARREAEKAKTTLKADILRIGKLIDTENGKIWDRCQAAEKHLKDIEDFEENERARLEQETRARRTAEITPFLTGPLAVDLGKITEEEYQRQLTDAQDLHALRKQREEEAKKAAEEQARKEREERERIAREAEERRLEVERLRKEAAEKEAARQAELDRLRKEQAEKEAQARKEREEAEARSRAQLAELEKKAKAEREAAEAKAQQERARLAEEARLAREQAAKERAAREQAEAAARQQAEAEEAARRKAAAAPDAEKLRAFAASLLALPVPSLSADSHATQQILADKINAFSTWVNSLADKLGSSK